jgi:IS4 transposase
LDKLFPEDTVYRIAKETGFIKRERVVNPMAFLWALVLGFGTHLQRTLAGLRRAYEKETDERIAESSWHGRFTPALVKFLKACVLHALHQTANDAVRQIDDKLSQFEDILIQDSTIIRLHEVLANKWPAARTRKVAAGIKVSLLISAIANGPKKITIHGERTPEIKTIRVGPWVKNRIILFDLGFYKFQMFARIKENGGFFVSRLKKDGNPLLLRSLKVLGAGRSI